jgi:flavin reductase (DIM6/NTAB) family NADH-FMN oxidoreductase RutF
LASGRDTDKFAAAGLTPVAAEFVDAPFVAEFPLVIECAVVQVHELGLHTQFIGEIKDVKVDEGCLDTEGNIEIRKLDPIAFALGDATAEYFALGASIGPAFSIGKVFVGNTGS